ncbi:MAG: hypothetical protein KR126chlam2_00986 [Chlamydiae bacterium]|nr:hypothetical protein [Chlamydiota bacterium]
MCRDFFPPCESEKNPVAAPICLKVCEEGAFGAKKTTCDGMLFPVLDNKDNPDAICSGISTSAGASLRGSSLSLLTVLGTLVLAPRSKTQLVMLTTAAALLAMNVLTTELARIPSN